MFVVWPYFWVKFESYEDVTYDNILQSKAIVSTFSKAKGKYVDNAITCEMKVTFP